MRLSDFVTETKTSSASIALHGWQQVERVPGLSMPALQLPGARRTRLIEAVIVHERDNAQCDGRGRWR